MLRLLLCIASLCLASLSHADDFLSPEAAFSPRLSRADDGHADIAFTMAPGYYLYRDKLHVTVDAVEKALELPPGKEKEDDTFGRVTVYTGALNLRVPLDGGRALSVRYQGCAEAGLCYPPQTLTLDLAERGGTPEPSAPGPDRAAGGDESARIAARLDTGGSGATLLFFFLAGLGLALTPCVFPMIPILSGILVGQGGPASRGRSTALAGAYVLGMSLSYAAAGVAAGLSGTLLSSALQTPWALGTFALIFVALALSMFGFYELQLPAALQSRLADRSGKLGGGLAGAFAMGGLSALIVGPCVAPPLAGALLYIGQSGNAGLGGLALWVMGLGMGVPLMALGLTAGSALPRAGAWMEGIKRVFGVALLATALWLVAPVLPAAAVLGATALLLIVPAIYLHALDPLPAQATGWMRFRKGLGLAMLVAGSAQLIGVFAGATDPLRPLAVLAGTKAWAASAAAGGPDSLFTRIRSVEDLDQRLAGATQPVMLDVSAEWCASCKEMERTTFAHPEVRRRLASLTVLQADITANAAADRAILQRFALFGPPGIVFLDRAGREIPGTRVVGYVGPEDFLDRLDRLPRL